jgi:hypothetical protein
MAKKKIETAADPPITTFSKAQIIRQEQYKERRDLLTALLKDDTAYTHADVQALIDRFMKGKVI